MRSLLKITALALAAGLATEASPSDALAATQVTDTGTFVATFANSNYSRTSVDFKVPFTSPPLVFVAEWNNAGNWIFCKTDSVTTKGAIVACEPVNLTATSYTTNIAWFAIGY